MNIVRMCLVVLAVSSVGIAQDLSTRPLIDSPRYDERKVVAEIHKRIRHGTYDAYTGFSVDLCVDDPTQCSAAVFAPYKKDGSTTGFEMEINRDSWASLPPDVQQAVIRTIILETWGHRSKRYSPLDVWMRGAPDVSPLDQLSPHAEQRYLEYSSPEHLVGGVGRFAYGPNCWYSAISAIADKGSAYARRRQLAVASWDKHRFMGPNEFRFHMQQFEEVSEPVFGDLVRYYLDDEIYLPVSNIFGGEIHAAVFVGKEESNGQHGVRTTRDVALTKNGRSDLDFLIFQEIKAMDELYLSELRNDDPLLTRYKGRDPRKKGYFRVRTKADLRDPAVVGKQSGCYPAYLIDQINYRDRWDCLAGKIDPPPGDGMSAFSYPRRWLKVDVDK